LRTGARAGVGWAGRALSGGGGRRGGNPRAGGARQGDNVRGTTGVPHAGVPAYLNAMDVLAAPSQTTRRWREQLGRMLIEAFACGVAVIGSDSGEIPYVVDKAGVIAPEADSATWCALLRELLTDSGRRSELAAR